MTSRLQHIIDSKLEVLRRETISRSPINYSEDMPSDQKDRYIRYLIEQQEEKDLELRAMKMAVEEFQSIHDGVAESLANLQKEMSELRSELSSERSKRKAAETRARKLDQQLKYAQKNRFGDKRQKARKDGKTDDPADREDEKDRFDGTDGTVSTRSVQENPAEGHPTEEKKKRDLSKRPEKYDTMSVEGAPVFHPTDDSKVPGRIIGRKPVKVFSFKMCLVEERFEYDKEGISPTERGERRQSLETKEIMIRLRSNLDAELAKEETARSPYLTEALNYLKKFWNGIFAYQKDGNYPIDNNIAERTIRKLTTQRNSMLHFGSDDGVEMAAAYHSVISTVKLHGMSSWHFLGEFFQKIFNGCRDFLSLTPLNIGLAHSKC